MRTNKKKIKEKYKQEYSFAKEILSEDCESDILKNKIQSSNAKDVVVNTFSFIALMLMIIFGVYVLIDSSVIVFKML